MNRNNPTTVNDNFSVSCTTGSGIQGAILNVGRLPSRILEGKWIIPCALDGQQFPSSAAAFAAAEAHGYLGRYGRNVCGFVASRASKRRGIAPTDRLHIARARYHAKRLGHFLGTWAQ